jgi:DHA2 family multidrug resistance protein
MMASLDTDTYGIQWVVISYLIGAAISMTAVGWVGAAIGHKATYILGLSVFIAMSMICGQAKNIEMMNISRFIQGIGEGLIVPIGMTIIYEVFPPGERGLAMGIYGLGASFAPALGPTIGGYLTEQLSWRWIFYINLPVGIAALFLSFFLLRETKPEEEKPLPFDLIGFILMAVSLGCLITFLSKGQEKGWFQSDYILWLIVSFVVLFPLFIVTQLKTKHPLVDLRLFKERNFTVTIIAFVLFSMNLYALMILLPFYLERLKLYPTLTAGLVLLPGATVAGISTVFGGILSDKLNQKYLLVGALIGLGMATFYFGGIDFYTPKSTVIGRDILWCITLGFVFPPATALCLKNLPEEKVNMGSSIQNAIRLIAGCIGTALVVTILERRLDSYFESLARYVNYGNIEAISSLKRLMGYFHLRGTPDQSLIPKALRMIDLYTSSQAYAYAIQATMKWMALFAFFAALIALFLKMERKDKEIKKSLYTH